MLLTAKNPLLRNNTRALSLACKAVAFEPVLQFLDTLAEACYQNGLTNEAVHVIQEAIKGAGENREYYESQLRKYRGGAST